MGANATAQAGKVPPPIETAGQAVAITRAELRRQKVLTVASDLFATKGFEATSMRDVATAANLMSGSLYYHFASKEEMYVAVQDASVSKIFNAVEAAIATVENPWARLEAAAVGHLEALLDRSGFRVLVTPIFPPGLAPAVLEKLVAQRNQFERMIKPVITALPLPASIDRNIFQKHYLGAINWVGIWYDPAGPFKPAEIARQIVATLRR
jgi:TetR/AcrR family transcriptional regulator, cholesterol catabolism regulator